MIICTSSSWSGHKLGQILPPPGEQRVKPAPSLLLLLHVVLFPSPSRALVLVGLIELSWPPVLSCRTRICPAVGKASWPSDWKSGIWPGKGLCSLEMSVFQQSLFTFTLGCLGLERSPYLLHPRNDLLLGANIIPVVPVLSPVWPASGWTAVSNHISFDIQTLCVLFFLDFLLSLYLGGKPIRLLQT